MAVLTRLELATSCVTGRRSNRLNYSTVALRRRPRSRPFPMPGAREQERGAKSNAAAWSNVPAGESGSPIIVEQDLRVAITARRHPARAVLAQPHTMPVPGSLGHHPGRGVA